MVEYKPMATSPAERARRFLEDESAFRLGALVTESPHPKTATLAATLREDTAAGVRLLLSVDSDIPPTARRACSGREFADLVAAMTETLRRGARIFLTGCGATGRLSLLLEASWRRFWRTHPELQREYPFLPDGVTGLMAGGEYALIRSVEGFEDFPDFGRLQLRQAGVTNRDLVVAITEGGETPFVIGTVWQGVEVGARVFFVYNNPSELLCECVERSREVIRDERVTKLDLATGPMALTGSTRMQAATTSLLVVGAALETALAAILSDSLPEGELARLAVVRRSPAEYPVLFEAVLGQLAAPGSVTAICDAIECEEAAYRRKGLVTYLASSFLLDVLGDTTERSPTFMIPPFRTSDDRTSPRPWAFVKNPLLTTPDAWRDMLGRDPAGLAWGRADYERVNAPAGLCENPPRLSKAEILKFQIGREDDPSRTDVAESVLIAILAGQEFPTSMAAGHPFREAFDGMSRRFTRTAVFAVGQACRISANAPALIVPCELPASPLGLWAHLALKMALNALSTATMARMGRVKGNSMVYVSPSNKKLIDRGTRLVAQLTGLSYEEACIALHESMAELESRTDDADEPISPVALAVERILARRA